MVRKCRCLADSNPPKFHARQETSHVIATVIIVYAEVYRTPSGVPRRAAIRQGQLDRHMTFVFRSERDQNMIKNDLSFLSIDCFHLLVAAVEFNLVLPRRCAQVVPSTCLGLPRGSNPTARL